MVKLEKFEALKVTESPCSTIKWSKWFKCFGTQQKLSSSALPYLVSEDRRCLQVGAQV